MPAPKRRLGNRSQRAAGCIPCAADKAWTERRETEVVGVTGLTTDDQYGMPEHTNSAHRCDFQANPLKAVVVRQW